MVGVERFYEIENDISHEWLGADGGRVVEGLLVKVIRVVAEDFLLAGGEAFFFFKAEHHGDVLVAVEAIGDEEGDDDGVWSLGHLGPISDEGRLFHVSVMHGGEVIIGKRFDQLDLIADRFGRILIQPSAVTDDEEGGFFLRNSGRDFGGALEDE